MKFIGIGNIFIFVNESAHGDFEFGEKCSSVSRFNSNSTIFGFKVDLEYDRAESGYNKLWVIESDSEYKVGLRVFESGEKVADFNREFCKKVGYNFLRFIFIVKHGGNIINSGGGWYGDLDIEFILDVDFFDFD